MEPEQTTNGNGALIGSMIIVVILVIGGIYFWKVSMEERATELENNTSDSGVESSSEMEAELDSIDLESLDSEI